MRMDVGGTRGGGAVGVGVGVRTMIAMGKGGGLLHDGVVGRRPPAQAACKHVPRTPTHERTNAHTHTNAHPQAGVHDVALRGSVCVRADKEGKGKGKGKGAIGRIQESWVCGPFFLSRLTCRRASPPARAHPFPETSP